MTTAFGIADIHRAAERLAGRVVRTPVLSSPMLDDAARCSVFIKAEPLQRTGAFKFRGALNKLLTLDAETLGRGVVAYSSGNHGHAIAAASREVGCPAVIVLPKNTVRIKVENIRWWGAEIVFYDPETEDRESVGRAVAEQRGMLVVPPFDDYDIIAGAGTLGLEFSEQLAERGVVPDAFVVCCSGGGPASGATTAMKDAYPTLPCYFVEPAGLEKMAPSVASGIPHKRPDGPPTIMDGISGPVAGRRPMEILRAHGATGLSVTDDEALDAMAAAFRFLKLVVEPGGAAALAAVLSAKADFVGMKVAVVCTGGNADNAVFSSAITRTS